MGKAKANPLHDVALEVKDELEITNATDTINDELGGGTVIADADDRSGAEGEQDGSG